MSSGRLLLVLPLPIYVVDGRYFLDTQACNGLRLWLDNFPAMTLAGPAETAAQAPASTSLIEATLDADKWKRLTVLPLPRVYLPHRFAAVLPKTIGVLKAHIGQANYLQFAIGGLWGDWASVGCLIARRLGLPYAVWTDRVESSVVEFESKSKRGWRRLYTLARAKMMARIERYVIRRAALGLFHGMDCYEAYAPYCRNPHVVHDVHLSSDFWISEAELKARLERSRRPLDLVYAGRAHLEKGVFDWIEALSIAARKNADFTATWFGGGPELEAARERVKQLKLADRISFPGPLARDELLQRLRGADAFVFCHKTRESPRCLLEALMCALPIIGYDSGFPQDLIRNGGGLLTRPNDPAAIAGSIAAIEDRTLLHDLSLRAKADGRQFTDEGVFRHRSVLMKTIRIGDAPRAGEKSQRV